MAEGEESPKRYSRNYLTPRNIFIYLIIGGLLYAAMYYFLLRNNENTNTPYPEVPVEQKATQENAEGVMSVALTEQNGSGQDGSVTLTQNPDGKVTVSVNVTPGATGIPQPAHIHMGACPTPGEVVYPLTNVIDGKSETVLQVDLATIRGQLPLAVNVHKSEAEVQVYVACGDVK